jgi:hypothetical protein
VEEQGLHKLADKTAVVGQKRGNVGEEVFWAVDAIRRLVALEVISKPHLERLDQNFQGQQHRRELDLGARPGGVVGAVELRQLQVQELPDGRLPLLLEVAWDGGFGGGPANLGEQLVQIRGEGIKDLSAKVLGDGVHVVEQLGCRTLGVVVESQQPGVEGPELLVRRKGSLVGGSQAGLGVVSGGWAVSADLWSAFTRA